MDEISGFMSKDHGRIDALLERFRGSGNDPEKVRESLEAFRAALERHIEWEERALFPAFEDKTGSEGEASTDAMRLQHEELRRQISDLRRCSIGDPANRRNLEEVLIEYLKEHNYAEESFIYPWIDSELPPQEKEAILLTLEKESKGGE